ncbi:MAG: endonuclease/exonuclease/phosphatase family protein [Pseudolabrys sp.]|nr:endonuclease/exonuclease/phosphatase family protein [Pseudolabrys sp.]
MRAHRSPRLPANILSVLRQERTAYRSRRSATGAGALIASYNVHKCVGMDNRFDPERIMNVIGEIGADVLALQEAAQRFGDKAALLDLPLLEREYGLIAVPALDEPNGQCWYGNFLLFREGIVRAMHRLKLPGVEPRGALVVDIDLDAGPLRIVAAHLGLLRRSRAKQTKAILRAVCERSERPTLLLGDLNEWRLGQKSSLHALGPEFGPVAAALPTFPSRFPVFALDRILGNPESMVLGIEVHATPLARVASDHLPIKARIDVVGAGAQFERVAGRMAA